MQLSEAILLGDSLKKGNPHIWLTEDGSCGCAIGGALLAAGANPARVAATPAQVAYEMWPWLNIAHLVAISRWYYAVHGIGTQLPAYGIPSRAVTIEEVAAYVRSIEPPESEPQPDGDPGDENDAKPQPSTPVHEPAPVAA